MTAALSSSFPQLREQSIGSFHGTLVTVTLATNDYVTGGIDFSSVCPSGDFVGAIVLSSTGTGAVTQIPVVDTANKKLMLMIGAAGVSSQAANGSSDAQVVRLLL